MLLMVFIKWMRAKTCKKGRNMEPTYFLSWLAGGGLVTLVTYAILCLLKSAQRIEDAEEEKLWQYLLHPQAM